MALAVNYFTVATAITSSTPIYTVATTGYTRDLVITNSGTNLCYVTLGASSTGAAAATGFAVPTGQSVVLTGQANAAAYKIYAYAATATNVSLGWASVVSVI